MKPVIAIVGRPNVGKSTLFNKLTRSRNALVADEPGVTRDWQLGDGRLGERNYLVIDTGGINEQSGELSIKVSDQATHAAAEADAIIFLTDGREGCTSLDEMVATRLRQLGKPTYLAVNKSEGKEPEIVSADFYGLGFREIVAISAAHNDGLDELIELVLDALPEANDDDIDIVIGKATQGIRICVLGRPNVGKSTLINRILGEERLVTSAQPGTTRDAIATPFVRDSQEYVLVDTAGVRRRGRITDVVEKFSVVKTLQAIDLSHVIIVVVDAQEGVTDQDANLLGMAVASGKALVVAINKWDGLSDDQREFAVKGVERKLRFADYIKVHNISALHGSGVGDLFGSISKAYKSAFVEVGTSKLNRILADATFTHPPPTIRGRRIKMRYAHIGGHNPPTIVIHGNQVKSVPASYRRYLEGTFRKALQLVGTPVRIEFRQTDNPFQGKKNVLTTRQLRRRRRLRDHVRKR